MLLSTGEKENLIEEVENSVSASDSLSDDEQKKCNFQEDMQYQVSFTPWALQ